jgi:transcriptional regulator with XRE-family HTH domain
MKTTKQLLGARIKVLRKRMGLSQAELSEKIEIAQNFLSRIEVGSNFPSLETLEKMSKALEVELKDFFDFDYLQDGSTEVANLERLLQDASDEKRKLAFRVIMALLK